MHQLFLRAKPIYGLDNEGRQWLPREADETVQVTQEKIVKTNIT